MKLVSATVGPFRSINSPQTVEIDPLITVLVGMNEAGKTVFLRALEKSGDALGIAKFEPVEDYPRKDLSLYLKKHQAEPSTVTTLRYQLTPEEVAEVNGTLHTNLTADFSFGVTRSYDNTAELDFSIDEAPVVKALAATEGLSSDAVAALEKVGTLRAIPGALGALGLTDKDKAFLATIDARIKQVEAAKWSSVVEREFYLWADKRIPKFMYFGDYDFLPSKTNLPILEQRAVEAKTNPGILSPEDRGVLSLLRMADVSVSDFKDPGGYETLRAKLEAVSINLTDQIMKFWKQNEDLEVLIDITTDPADQPPFNTGPNLYLRIVNRRHRGVSTPFGLRSHGFIWFFSFLVWFDDVRHELTRKGRPERDLVLLLDEPGLSLHALAQRDFLAYIDDLSSRHQVVYTTHSPFLVHVDRLHQVRLLEDRPEVGTVIFDTVGDMNDRTVFPLQAALGWTIAQSLFIGERNLIVEGPADLLYLKAVSAMLETAGRTGLRESITIVPAGGLDKVATFVALLGANELKLAVLHDWRGAPEQRLMDLVREKMISPKAIFPASMYREVPAGPGQQRSTDLEDLLPLETYVGCFNRAYEKLLGAPIAAADLPPGDRVTDRLERYLEAAKVRVRPSGGFNHYVVALEFASQPPALDAPALDRFEALFKDVNKLLGS